MENKFLNDAIFFNELIDHDEDFDTNTLYNLMRRIKRAETNGYEFSSIEESLISKIAAYVLKNERKTF